MPGDKKHTIIISKGIFFIVSIDKIPQALTASKITVLFKFFLNWKELFLSSP
jgi:hypothetical protein